MKGQFIKFLRENHALQEFDDAIKFTSNIDLDQAWNFVELKHEIIADGHVIFWQNGLSDVDWERLDREWRSYLDSIGYMKNIYTEKDK